MAKRLCFFVDSNCVREEYVEFVYIKGMSFSQKVKCAESLRNEINKLYPICKHLEVSTKSSNPLGKQLSAFNLMLNNHYVESIFQSSKVFEGDIQFSNLINCKPIDAKKYIKESGQKILKCFHYEDKNYPLIPRTSFYDWIYINALDIHDEKNTIVNYDVFSDIEFNDGKSINCQARAVALYVLIKRMNKEKYYLSSFDNFVHIYNFLQKKNITLFD